MESATKSTWITNARRFALEAESFEKKSSIALRLAPEHVDLMKECSDFAAGLNESKITLSKKMGQFRNMLGEVQSRLQNGNWLSPHHDLQQQLEQFEHKLTAFKVLMRNDFEAMESQCKITEADVIKLAKDVDDWSNDGLNGFNSEQKDLDANNAVKYTERNKKDLERRSKLGGIDRKIAGLRKCDGWDQSDDDSFIRVWNQVFDMTELITTHSQRAQVAGITSEYEAMSELDDVEQLFKIPEHRRLLLLKKLSIAVPIKNREELEQRIKWYLHFLHLTELKKKLVAEWKREQIVARRHSNQEALISEVLDTEEYVTDIDGLISRHHSESEMVQNKIAEEERIAAKERIAKWRAARVEQQRQEELEKTNLEREHKQHDHDERKKRQTIMRQQLENWKQAEALSKELVEESKTATHPPKSLDAASLRRMQTRDMETAKARQQRVDDHRRKSTNREVRLKEVGEQLGTFVERDPSRLTSSTKAFEMSALRPGDLELAERRRSSATAHSSRVALQGRDLHNVGRGVPVWCKPPL